MEFETVIGLEVHVQLKTRSKHLSVLRRRCRLVFCPLQENEKPNKEPEDQYRENDRQVASPLLESERGKQRNQG